MEQCEGGSSGRRLDTHNREIAVRAHRDSTHEGGGRREPLHPEAGWESGLTNPAHAVARSAAVDTHNPSVS